MTLVVPAWTIEEVLNMPKHKDGRDAENKRLRAEMDALATPIEESALPPEAIAEKRDAGLRKALSTPPSPQNK
jgi:hypothetical protein